MAKKKLNPLNTRSKKQTGFAIAILNSPTFKAARKKTMEGKKLFNQEITKVKKAAKKFGIDATKIPKKIKL